MILSTPRPFLALGLFFLPAIYGQTGAIFGSVVDSSGASVARALVKLGPMQETQSSDSGEFSFQAVQPGSYPLSFSATGFAAKTIQVELKPGDTLTLPPVVLSVDAVNTEVTVTQTQAEIAEGQIKKEEEQRLIGLVPNYFVVYDPDAAPLTTKQKLELTWKTYLDPATFVINGMSAAVGQARNDNKGFGQGAQGYGKRYGAGLAEFGTGLFLEKVVFTSVFKQDPRYFYKGTGTTRERFFYAISRSVVCRGDNKQTQFCYSTFLNRFASGFLTNYYYPSADRNSNATILQGAFIGIGADALGNLFQEFLAKKLTHKKP